MTTRPWLRPAITAVFYVLLVGFLGYYLIFQVPWGQLSRLAFTPVWLLGALVLALAFRYWQTFIWITVLRGLGARGVRMDAELTYVYAKSWMGRYIPGTAPWILGKIYFASQHGVSKTKLGVGSLLEAAIQIAVLLSTSSIMLFLDPRLNVPRYEWLRPAMIAVVVLCAVALIPRVFNWCMALAFRILRRPALARENYANARTILTATAQYVVGAFLSGGSLFFILKSLYPSLAFSDAFFVIASGNLAGAASMLVVIAPSGVGVREGIQFALLAVVMPVAIAAIAVIVTRLWGIAMDLLFFGAGRIALTISRRRAR
ncbi:lysylphosphatidylglycerol synthase domain-containing protein [Galbitalea soli]|uniref:Flippase-like domain-containing protein n=1 Tax=Galbitalea soli TaxID=1268042 RepID=A0A7C9TQC2_9MICO|nr:lysylphosphatidylglycerol synthase domain-containing protein [Galbitalea soli]NEM91337.1 hypothetical protein [Galbitalea soli]NYJ30027.1 uncharacterized membrane protein YbhN (UPF0104 family) [Galbitalea soli]